MNYRLLVAYEVVLYLKSLSRADLADRQVKILDLHLADR